MKIFTEKNKKSLINQNNVPNTTLLYVNRFLEYLD